MKLYNEKLEHCIYEYTYYKDVDYGYYVRTSLEITNNGAEDIYVSSNDFRMLDRAENEYEDDRYVVGDDCEDADEFKGATIGPGETITSQLWYSVGHNPNYVYGNFYIIFEPDGKEIVYKGYLSR